MTEIVPNLFPAHPSARRIAIIGEAPGADEVRAGQPFVGASGQLLDSFLSHAGIDRAACFVGNVCQQRPPSNLIGKFDWNGAEIQGGIARLTADLTRFQPHLCLLLGNTALRAFAGEKRSISEWRGYMWRAAAVAPGVKCVGAWHPAAIIRDMGLQGEQKFYLKRAVEESRSDELIVPPRHIEWNLKRDDIIDRFRAWRRTGTMLAADIEGGCGLGPACHGFADSANHAVVLPIFGVDGVSIWSQEDELLLMEECAALWQDESVPKIIQNAPYEMFVLAWTLGITVEGLVDDTMIKHAELYAELDKALEFQACIYTRQPFWKLHHRKAKGEERYVPYHGADVSARPATSEEWFIYNGTDCCVTYEVNTVMDGLLKPGQRRHYEWNVKHVARTTYASLHGWPYWKEEAARRLKACMESLYEKQDEINREAATSGSRPKLREFYQALGLASDDANGPAHLQHHGDPSADSLPSEIPVVQPQDWQVASVGQETEGVGVSRGALIPFLTSAFCRANRKEKREVTETWWQPMRWNGKKWVKGGKRVSNIFETADESAADGTPKGIWTKDEPPREGFECQWFKRIAKTITRNVEVEIKTFEDVRHWSKDSCSDACKRALQICAQGKTSSLLPAQRGELATLLGLSIKLNATGRGRDEELEGGAHQRGSERDANWFVYEHCGSPKHFTKEAGRLTENLTSNDSALISIWLEAKDPRIKAFMEWRSLDTRREALLATTDPDGRMRCGYIIPGTETMRMACRKSPTGSGYNLQTVTEELRDLFRAPEGCEVGKADLKAGDAWTIAAECLRLGDPTMLLDLQAGIKPANVVALIYKHGASINSLTREELLVKQREILKEDWVYIAAKKVVYGGTYLMGAIKMSETLREDSYKETGTPVFVSPRKCEEIQEQALFLRYPGIKAMHTDSGQRMMDEGRIVTSLGWQRQFFGRKADFKMVKGVRTKVPNRQTLGEWLGCLPQFYTTASIKLCLERLWDDPENRNPDGSLRVKPIHTVHDEIDTVWRVEDREFARRKLPAWFQNPINICGTKLSIPSSMSMGLNWRDQEEMA